MTKVFEDDLVLEEDKIFEESIEVQGNIRCEDGRHHLTVKGDIDAWNIAADDIDARNIAADDIDARNIYAWDIAATNIDAWDIDARDIDARDIDARSIDARSIDARSIDADDIDARDIDATNIDARSIDADDIDANDISFYAYCISYQSLKCRSIEGLRENSLYQCLDQEIQFKEKESEICDCCGQKLEDKEEA